MRSIRTQGLPGDIPMQAMAGPGGTPIAGWSTMEHPIEMDNFGGTPILGNPGTWMKVDG